MPSTCPKCGRLEDDHLCITSKDGVASSREVEVLRDKVEKQDRKIVELEGQIEHMNRYALHRPADTEPMMIRCSCGSIFHDYRTFHEHQAKGGN